MTSRSLAKYSGTIGNVLDVDVLPHVDFGPVREREDADAFARPQPSVQQVPELGPLVLRIPLALRVAQRRRCAPWRASAPRRAERRRRRRRSCPASSASSSDLVFSSPQQRCVPTRKGCVPSAIASSLVWTISRAPIWPRTVAELDHLAELVGRVDVQQRERNRTRMERLLRQAQQDGRVLADGVEHHRAFELGDDLADDVDAFRFERPQMVDVR